MVLIAGYRALCGPGMAGGSREQAEQLDESDEAEDLEPVDDGRVFDSWWLREAYRYLPVGREVL